MSKLKPYAKFGHLLTEGVKRLAYTRREGVGLTQQKLAERLGYSTDALHVWRRGEYLPDDPEVVANLAREFVKGWQADQRWVNNFLEQGWYGPSQAVEKLNRELFDKPAKVDKTNAQEALMSSIAEQRQNKTSLAASSNSERETRLKQRIQVYLQGDFSSLTAEREAAAITAFAAVIGISPQAIEVYHVYAGSIIFDLGLPPEAVERLQQLLAANSEHLHRLKLERVILEQTGDRAEIWEVKDGKFYQVNITQTNTTVIGDRNITGDINISGNVGGSIVFGDQVTQATPPQPSASELADRAKKAHLTIDDLIREFKVRREFTPAEDLNLVAHLNSLRKAFEFVSIKWSSFFGFTVAFVKADDLSRTQIKGLSQNFFEFNDGLYKNPQGLNVSRLAWWLAFTLSGVICFVFEQGCSDEDVNFIGNQKKGSPAYDEGMTSLKWAVQSNATSFSWTIDLRRGQVYKHLGKEPDRASYHTRKTLEEISNLENILKTIVS